MKKVLTILMSLMMLTSIILTGCAKPKEEPVNDELDSSSTPIVVNDEDDHDVDNTEDNPDVDADNNEDVENNPALEAKVEEAQSRLEKLATVMDDYADINISVQGNAIVCTCTYKENVSDSDKETFESMFDSKGAQLMLASLKVIQQEVEESYIIIKVFDTDGTELLTKEIK